MKTVIMTDLRTRAAQEAAEYLKMQGYAVQIVPEDIPLWDEAALSAWAEPFRDALIGVIHPAPPVQTCGILEITPEAWDRAALEGPVAALIVTKVFCGIFRKKRQGAMIYLNSIHAEKPVGKGYLYSLGCGAVEMLAKEACQDYGADRVGVYFVERGILPEDQGQSDVSALYFNPQYRYPDQKMPEESYLNGLLAFLLTPAALPLSGSPLQADAGMVGFYYFHRAQDEPPREIPTTGGKNRRDPQEIADALRPEEPEERVALVTGSGKGVGAGVVRVLARHGVRCCINCRTHPEMAAELEQEVLAADGEAFVYQADVTDPAQVRAMVETVIKRYGRLDILVNNAALQPNQFLDEYTAEDFRSLWETNIGGYVNAVRAALPYIRKSPAGRIVDMSSIHGKRPTVFDVGYAMTKGAIRMFTRELALELLVDQIPVNAIDLGACKIEFKTEERNGSFSMLKYADTHNPQMPEYQRYVLPEEVGHLIWFLLSRPGSALTGDGIRVDRGNTLY
ncbi:MAG: SDR family NAD(P)-dependent oxidoreductase [Firmicutes bacterium]|nr:SDR family NAD(P)-dependent oxidoreductase [Bacillota bacterium]